VRCWSTTTHSIAVLAIVVAHCALVPIAISLTLRVLGFENALTIRNQITWTPIVGAQCSLLALYLGFGAGHAYLRGSLFAAGITYVLLSVVWANSMLCMFPDPKFHVWLAQIRGYSLSFVLPTFLAGIALIPFRLLLGTARGQQSPSKNQFRIADLLVVTFLVAAILGWYQYAMDDQLRQAIDIRNSATWTVFNAAGAVGCLLLVLSRKWWWIGGIVFIISLLAQYFDSRNGGWSVGRLHVAYSWGIVIMTLTPFRLLGVRLHRHLPATAE
jgi:nitrate reductase gamma subunit